MLEVRLLRLEYSSFCRVISLVTILYSYSICGPVYFNYYYAPGELMSIKKTIKKAIPESTFKAIEPYGHLGETAFQQVKQGFPAKDLKIIGVTGTNGKTTTCFMIHKMLVNAGVKAGLMTTVAYGVGDDLHPQIEHMTTVPSAVLLKRLKNMKSQGVEWVVLETTSHAMAQHRTWGIDYSIAVMTNVTHEHLDYHGTFANYLKAKVGMFKQANKNKNGLQLGVINVDDPNSDAFSDAINNSVTYGIDSGDLRASNVKLSPAGAKYTAKVGNETYNIITHIPGKFNVYNSLAAVVVGRAVGLSKVQIEQGIAALNGVEGRMTRIDLGQDFDVIVDFAHTPDSFEKLFKDLKPVVKGNLIVMFGSAGRRDEAKRAVQGGLAGKYADIVVVTEEDDRDIDGVRIMEEIAAAAITEGKVKNKDIFLVHDRSEAIKFAIKTAKKGDTVLLLGKGHEKTIERADGEHDWDEIGLARKILTKVRK